MGTMKDGRTCGRVEQGHHEAICGGLLDPEDCHAFTPAVPTSPPSEPAPTGETALCDGSGACEQPYVCNEGAFCDGSCPATIKTRCPGCAACQPAVPEPPTGETELEAARRRFPHDLGGDEGRVAWHRAHTETAAGPGPSTVGPEAAVEEAWRAYARAIGLTSLEDSAARAAVEQAIRAAAEARATAAEAERDRIREALEKAGRVLKDITTFESRSRLLIVDARAMIATVLAGESTGAGEGE